MKLVFVAALALVACAAAAPVDNIKEPVNIIKSEFDQRPDGQYQYSYETGDGITKQETGEVKTLTNDKNESVDVIVVRGSYTYTDPEGQKHVVTYTADESGFRYEIEPKA